MQLLWVEQQMKYDGSQLRPLYNYLDHGVLGDSIVAWRGPCDIPPEHIIDGEDLRAKSIIAGSDMVHMVIELFDMPLSTAIALQRLLGENLILKINQMVGEKIDFQRFGDDVFWGKKKLNISIATKTATSSLIHFGFNVKNEGTPVETCALEDFKINDPKEFAMGLMEACRNEVMGIKRAMVKVRSF